jgi:fructose-1,6-bisphosphatase/sedoheptulose 1,7-bisphosphatase-like protein
VWRSFQNLLGVDRVETASGIGRNVHGGFLRSKSFLIQNCAVQRKAVQIIFFALPLKDRLRNVAKKRPTVIRQLEIRCVTRLSEVAVGRRGMQLSWIEPMLQVEARS